VLERKVTQLVKPLLVKAAQIKVYVPLVLQKLKTLVSARSAEYGSEHIITTASLQLLHGLSIE
jgi:hypothetical protein